MKKIIIGSDHRGLELKEILKSHLKKKGIPVKDIGAYTSGSCDYPKFAYAVAKAVSSGEYERGILVCYTGIGNSIVANRFKGVRAALCYNMKAARLSRQHNDSNVLVLGSAFIRPDLAKRIVSAWFATEFEGGRHRRRLNQIKGIERLI